MGVVDNFQRLMFGNSWSPDKFTGKRKTKIIVIFTFTLRTIYEFNGTYQYLERSSLATDNDTIITALLHHEKDYF